MEEKKSIIPNKKLPSYHVTKLANNNKYIEAITPEIGGGVLFETRDAKDCYGYIYRTVNLINNKIYIGKRNFNPKLKPNKEYLGSGKILNDAIKKHGRENFIKNILEYCFTKENLNERERFWIKFYDSRNNEIGYNISEGGDWGEVLSSFPEELRLEIITRRNKSIQKALKGVPHSKERNSKKSSNWHKQKKFECEFCHKLLQQSLIKKHRLVCKSNPNRKHTEETKLFLRLINLGELNPSAGKKKTE